MNRLLVMDDEIELGRFVGRVGESVGYSVKIASRVNDFKNCVVQWKPTVITLDLAMPEADGLELLRWLASESSKTQIVIMSGFDGRVIEAAKQIGRERGLNIVFSLTKPVRVPELKEKLLELRNAGEKFLDEVDLNQAIIDKQLFINYQPKVALETGELRGVEALVRWQHPTHGLILPDNFVTLAEETGGIKDVADMVIMKAVAQQKAWAGQGVDIQMAINLSPFNLMDQKTVEFLVAHCQEQNVAPDRIILEITESAAMSNALESLDALTRLRLKGFKLSIDDFGSGYSSLQRLRRLPCTELKIDKSFIADMLTSQDSFIIVKTIIGMAQTMGLSVTAEGIESDDQFRVLAHLGCEMGQGFAIGKPMEAEQMPTWKEVWTAGILAITKS